MTEIDHHENGALRTVWCVLESVRRPDEPSSCLVAENAMYRRQCESVLVESMQDFDCSADLFGTSSCFARPYSKRKESSDELENLERRM